MNQSLTVYVSNIFSFFFQCLLNESEIEIKTKLWMEENKEYLQKQKGEFGLQHLIVVYHLSAVFNN